MYVILAFLLLLVHGSKSCLQDERTALLEIKSYLTSINSSSHHVHLLPWWVLGNDCCEWGEVRCDPSTRHVIRLYLNYTMPFDQPPWPLNLTVFQPLQELISLSLPWNSIGSLVDGFQVLQNLKKLQVLDLSNNHIVGMVTPHGLCDSKSLQQLHLDSNMFNGGLPTCIGNVTSLRVIDVSHNHLTGTITSILSNLTSLVYLDITDNHFDPISIHRSFSNAPSLIQLYLSNNNLLQADNEEDIHWKPPFQLAYLQLNFCNLSKFPVQFLSNQHNLYHVEMSGNGFIGSFPTWLLRNNSRLQSLYLGNNSLSGSLQLPNHHQNLSLADLDVSHNSLNGTLQENIGMILPNLQTLDASHNHLQGKIPTSIGNMTMIQTLDLSNNNFSGELPKTLFTQCNSLFYIYLSNNHLEGEVIPKAMNQTQLSWLFLEDNHFSEIPEDASFTSNHLTCMDISNNNMLGKIPRWIGEFLELEILSMAGNKLKGNIPDELCQITSLSFLDLSTNELEGPVPSCFSKISGLSYLHLHNNGLSGNVPYALSNGSNLKILDLSYNRLSGGIPSWIDRLSNLRALLLGGNFLRGELPTRLCHLRHLNIMDLSSNGISGQIPSCLREMSFGTNGTNSGYFQEQLGINTKGRNYDYVGSTFMNMSGLDLSCNWLTGQIPLELGDLKRIHTLNLSHNHLSGPIPSRFSKLKTVESLDLCCNNLSGGIPFELGALNFLEIFNVSYNNLSGKPPMSGQFATFDADNYRGNPLLCGYSLGRSCSPLPPSAHEDNDNGDGEEATFDWKVFLWSFGMGHAIFFLAFISKVLYINC